MKEGNVIKLPGVGEAEITDRRRRGPRDLDRQAWSLTGHAIDEAARLAAWPEWADKPVQSFLIDVVDGQADTLNTIHLVFYLR